MLHALYGNCTTPFSHHPNHTRSAYMPSRCVHVLVHTNTCIHTLIWTTQSIHMGQNIPIHFILYSTFMFIPNVTIICMSFYVCACVCFIFSKSNPELSRPPSPQGVCMYLPMQRHFKIIISLEKLKHGWTLTTSQYTITPVYILKLKEQLLKVQKLQQRQQPPPPKTKNKKPHTHTNKTTTKTSNLRNLHILLYV